MNKKDFKSYSIITFGIILVAISVEYFFAPNNLAAGGVTGAAIVVNALIPNLSVGVLTFIMNAALFVVAFMFIDGNFGVKTIYASLGLSVILWIIEKLFNTFLIEKSGNDIHVTNKGKQLLKLVPQDLKEPELTAKWEMELSDIAQGKSSKKEFLDAIENEIKEAVLTYRK